MFENGPWDGRNGADPPSTRKKPSIEDYLDNYGFSIPVEPTRYKEVDRSIQNPGSFYSYSRGGGVTIVDPARGKVYFAYAG